MARPFTALELISELQFWIKSPTDPSLRKLLRRTIQTLNAFKDLVGEPEPSDEPYVKLDELPSISERIKTNES